MHTCHACAVYCVHSSGLALWACSLVDLTMQGVNQGTSDGHHTFLYFCVYRLMVCVSAALNGPRPYTQVFTALLACTNACQYGQGIQGAKKVELMTA